MKTKRFYKKFPHKFDEIVGWNESLSRMEPQPEREAVS